MVATWCLGRCSTSRPGSPGAGDAHSARRGGRARGAAPVRPPGCSVATRLTSHDLKLPLAVHPLPYAPASLTPLPGAFSPHPPLSPAFYQEDARPSSSGLSGALTHPVPDSPPQKPGRKPPRRAAEGEERPERSTGEQGAQSHSPGSYVGLCALPSETPMVGPFRR